MQEEAIKRVISEWLVSTELPSLTPREIDIPNLNPPRPIIAVVGPRRAGKTYFLYQLIGKLLHTGAARREDILFVDFEDYRLRDFHPEDMDHLLRAFFQLTGRRPRYLFFDEVHQLPSWSRVIRTLHNTRKYSIIVTGSNASLLGSEIASELRGRYEDILILPFSFREYLAHRQISWTPESLSLPEAGLILRAFDEYLHFGGFPEVTNAQDERAKRKLMQVYYDMTFYRDVVERYSIRAQDLLELLMRNLLEYYASRFSISSFEKKIKAYGRNGSKKSIANYLRYLEEAFFITSCEKFAYSPTKRTMNPKKVYLMDTGFTLLSTAFSENRGRLLENLVATELFRNRIKTMYFKGRGECDFIIKRGVRIEEAWQVCWELNEANEKRELKGLIEAWNHLGIKRGGVFTYNQEGIRVVNNYKIQLRPVWKWLLNIYEK